MGPAIMRSCLNHLIFCTVLSLIYGSSAFGVVKPEGYPWIRTNSPVTHIKINSTGTWLAYSGKDGMGLTMMNIKTRELYEITPHQIGPSWFWSPDGFRIFYREHLLNKKDEIYSRLKAWDRSIKKNVSLGEYNGSTGFLTFDPRDLRMKLMHESGIVSKRIRFPDERLAQWQIAHRNQKGRWVATQKAILWLTQKGLAIKRLDDDQTGIQSFDLSSDGQMMVWATNAGNIFMCRDGQKSKKIAEGFDPAWHPDKSMIVYSFPRKVGHKTINYDLKVLDITGKSRFLTQSQISSERWPRWLPKGNKIVYTVEKTTDLYMMEWKL